MMRSLFIYISLLTIFCFCSATTFAAEDANSTAAEDTNSIAAEQLQPDKDQIAQAEPADSNGTIDPNAPIFKDLNKFLEKFGKGAKRDSRELSKGDIEKSQKRIKSAQTRAKKQMKILRDIAESEDAVKTVFAIDRLIQARDRRFEEIQEKLKEAREKQRGERKKGDSRRDKKRSRDDSRRRDKDR